MDTEDARDRLEEERIRLAGLREGFEADGLTSESEEESLVNQSPA